MKLSDLMVEPPDVPLKLGGARDWRARQSDFQSGMHFALYTSREAARFLRFYLSDYAERSGYRCNRAEFEAGARELEAWPKHAREIRKAIQTGDAQTAAVMAYALGRADGERKLFESFVIGEKQKADRRKGGLILAEKRRSADAPALAAIEAAARSVKPRKKPLSARSLSRVIATNLPKNLQKTLSTTPDAIRKRLERRKRPAQRE